MANEDMPQFEDRYFVSGIIDHFEEKMAVILTKDGQKLLWPITNLPPDLEKGAAVRLLVSTSSSDQHERENIAKTVLNEILNNTGSEDGQK